MPAKRERFAMPLEHDAHADLDPMRYLADASVRVTGGRPLTRRGIDPGESMAAWPNVLRRLCDAQECSSMSGGWGRGPAMSRMSPCAWECCGAGRLACACLHVLVGSMASSRDALRLISTSSVVGAVSLHVCTQANVTVTQSIRASRILHRLNPLRRTH
jgi:hypothetical protein